MKKNILTVFVAILLVSCNQKANESNVDIKPNVEERTPLKTAYIDTKKLMLEYQEFIDFETKFAEMSKRMQEEIARDTKKFQKDVVYFQKNAQSKGMDWAVKRQKQLERREKKLAEKQQNFAVKLQKESGEEREVIIKKMKDFISDYGNKKGLDYVFGTGEVSTVLFSQDEYNITDEIIKQMNDAFMKVDDVNKDDVKPEAKEKVKETKEDKKSKK